MHNESIYDYYVYPFDNEARFEKKNVLPRDRPTLSEAFCILNLSIWWLAIASSLTTTHIFVIQRWLLRRIICNITWNDYYAQSAINPTISIRGDCKQFRLKRRFPHRFRLRFPRRFRFRFRRRFPRRFRWYNRPWQLRANDRKRGSKTPAESRGNGRQLAAPSRTRRRRGRRRKRKRKQPDCGDEDGDEEAPGKGNFSHLSHFLSHWCDG